MSEEFYDDDQEDSDFECPECGEELSEDEVCENEQCPCFGEEPVLAESDNWLRQQERKQMGITS